MTGSGPAPTRKILITAGTFLPGYKGGGPVRSLVDVLDHLPNDIVALLITSDRDYGDQEPYPGLSGSIRPYGRHRVLYIDPGSPAQALRALRVVRSTTFDLLYVNSFWSPRFTMFPVVMRLLGVIRAPRLLVAPRGELYAGALDIKSTKKQFALRLWGPLLRVASPTFQVTAAQEADAVRSILPWAKTLTQVNSRGREPLESPIRPSATPRLVFLSRVCAKKNLLLALRALEGVSDPVEFDIYGTLEDPTYWAGCERQIARLAPPVTVTYRGPVPHEQVHETLARYDAMVLPTKGENFGHVILESLSVGCPVITSPHTPWSDVLHDGGGAVVGDLSVASWSSAIQDLVMLRPNERMAAKHRVLRAYNEWREGIDDTPAVVQALEVP